MSLRVQVLADKAIVVEPSSMISIDMDSLAADFPISTPDSHEHDFLFKPLRLLLLASLWW